MPINAADRKVLKAAQAIIERETANDGDSIRVSGLGTFRRKAKAARTARNPRTGAPVAVPARSVLVFKASTTTRHDK